MAISCVESTVIPDKYGNEVHCDDIQGDGGICPDIWPAVRDCTS